MARLRGWVHVLRSRGWHRSWRQWRHWARLAVRSNPRLHVYAAGTELVFALSQRLGADLPPDLDCAELTSGLPMRMSPSARSGGVSWPEAARGVFLNYREFLVGTRS